MTVFLILLILHFIVACLCKLIYNRLLKMDSEFDSDSSFNSKWLFGIAMVIPFLNYIVLYRLAKMFFRLYFAMRAGIKILRKYAKEQPELFTEEQRREIMGK